MKTTKIRTALLAATAAVLLVPAAQAGGLGGALGGGLGGAVGGTMGGTFGPSMGTLGGSGNAAGNGQGAFGAPDLGRPIGRVRDAGDRVTERSKTAAGTVRDRAAGTQATASGAASGVASAAKSESPSTTTTPAATPAFNPSLGGDGVLGGSAGAETSKHEALLDAGSAGSAHADRSGANAAVNPSASAKAGRKAPPAEASAETTPAP